MQINVGLPQLDTSQSFSVTPGHQEVFARFRGTEQFIGHRHIEAPPAAHLAANPIAEDVTVTVEVQPQLSIELQVVVCRHFATAAFGDRQRFARFNAKRR